MIVMLDNVLKSIIQDSIGTIKQNPDVLDNMFLTMNPAFILSLKQFVKTKDIKVQLGFPREPANLPCIAILLGGEDEEPESIGDYLDNDDEVDRIPKEITEEIFIEFDSTLHRKIVTLNQVDIDSVESITTISGYPIEHYELIPNSFKVAIYDDVLDSKVSVTYSYFEVVQENYGTLMNVNYRLECWSDNAELTSHMYHLVKYILLSSRLKLANEFGVLKPKIGGGDLEPAPDYMPIFVYRRAATITGTIENSYVILEDIIDGLPKTEPKYYDGGVDNG